MSVGCSVYQGIDDAGGPGEDRGYDVQPRVGDTVVSYVHDHEGEETREEAEEDGEHQCCQAGVFFFLFGCLTAQFAVEISNVYILILINYYSSFCLIYISFRNWECIINLKIL